MSDRPGDGLHVEARRLRCETLEQMPSRGRAIGPSVEGKGDRPTHIKFMTFPPSRREGQTRSAKPKQEKKMETGQCEKRLARRGRAAVRLPSPAGSLAISTGSCSIGRRA